MQFKLEKVTDADGVEKKRKYSPCEMKQRADKACSRTRENLTLAFSCFRALKERLAMKSDAELTCFLLDRKVPNTGSLLNYYFSIKINVIFLNSLLCYLRYQQYKYK